MTSNRVSPLRRTHHLSYPVRKGRCFFGARVARKLRQHDVKDHDSTKSFKENRALACRLPLGRGILTSKVCSSVEE